MKPVYDMAFANSEVLLTVPKEEPLKVRMSENVSHPPNSGESVPYFAESNPRMVYLPSSCFRMEYLPSSAPAEDVQHYPNCFVESGFKNPNQSYCNSKKMIYDQNYVPPLPHQDQRQTQQKYECSDYIQSINYPLQEMEPRARYDEVSPRQSPATENRHNSAYKYGRNSEDYRPYGHLSNDVFQNEESFIPPYEPPRQEPNQAKYQQEMQGTMNPESRPSYPTQSQVTVMHPSAADAGSPFNQRKPYTGLLVSAIISFYCGCLPIGLCGVIFAFRAQNLEANGTGRGRASGWISILFTALNVAIIIAFIILIIVLGRPTRGM